MLLTRMNGWYILTFNIIGIVLTSLSCQTSTFTLITILLSHLYLVSEPRLG